MPDLDRSVRWSFAVLVILFVYLCMNAGRIMTCLSKGNIWRLRQKQDETPLSRGSRKRQTKSRHLSSRYFDLTFLINLLFGALL
jgi:hypothetical protein